MNGNKGKSYHIDKSLGCEKKEIKLIHIFEDEWIFHKDIVQSRLSHILKTNNNKVYARKCYVQLISSNESNTFLELNHLQGSDNSKIQLGLFYNKNLVGVMTFGHLRLALGNKRKDKTEYEMYRFCVSQNIIGAGGKLLSYFIKNYAPSKIISYADRRWSSSDSFYNKLGFNLISVTPPNYWYFGRGNNYKRYHRFGFAKHTLSKRLKTFDPLLTEWENMKNNGFDRIWDCGNLKYEWVNPLYL